MQVPILMFAGFVVALFVGAKLLPGGRHEGPPAPDGTRQVYKLNGMHLFVATNLIVGAGTLVFDLSLSPLVTHFWGLFAVANICALLIAWLLYFTGRRPATPSAPTGTWRALRAMATGTQLNPRWLGVDLKMFAYQPSLIGLGLLNTAFAYAQYETHGEISAAMGLYQVFWWVYLVTHYLHEEFMLQTWDVIAERFGLGLVWGDLVLVPFFYSIGGWYLIDDLSRPSLPAIVGISIVYGVGLWIFRGANAQKHRFKNDPRTVIWGKPAEALEGRLLVSGWWGLGRHLNYTGEVSVYLGIALTTGVGSIVPYLLPLWLLALLAHRALRDERRCSAKYGALWEVYCAQVRYRMIPFVY